MASKKHKNKNQVRNARARFGQIDDVATHQACKVFAFTTGV